MSSPSGGYHKLAAIMSNDKDTSIFRRFNDLNLLSLLSLNAEILELRQSLRRTCLLDDIHEQEDEKKYFSNFKLSRDNNSEQYESIEVLRHKLKDYSKRSLTTSNRSYRDNRAKLNSVDELLLQSEMRFVEPKRHLIQFTNSPMPSFANQHTQYTAEVTVIWSQRVAE